MKDVLTPYCLHLGNSMILGLYYTPKKSEFIPKQTIRLLGFILDSRPMKIALPADRETKIKECFLNLRSYYRSVSICDTARAIGYMVSCLPAVPFGGINYRALENDKIQALNCLREISMLQWL